MAINHKIPTMEIYGKKGHLIINVDTFPEWKKLGYVTKEEHEAKQKGGSKKAE